MGTTTKEYILKLDTAKEIAMVENNNQGQKIRKYFIEIEKKFKEQIKLQNKKANYLLAIYNGGPDAMEASKELVEMEKKPLLQKKLESLGIMQLTSSDNFTTELVEQTYITESQF